jgi:uncharacterized DUF497 family protein
MQNDFEWDEAKRSSNLDKHGIDFEDAILVFERPFLVLRSDRAGEERWLALGWMKDREIAVVFVTRDGRRRLISARRARTHEREEIRNRLPAPKFD